VVLDVQDVLEKAYEDGSYDSRIDYRGRCRPPLSAADQRWAREIINKARRSSRKK
jgi:hypothetical protein